MGPYTLGDLVHAEQGGREHEFNVSVIGRVVEIDADGTVWVDASPPEGSRWGLKPSVYKITRVEE